VKVKEVEKVEVDLSAVVRCVGLRAELHIALLVTVEDIGGGTEGREDLAELVVLVGLVEAGRDLVHRRHRAARCHVDPQRREEAEDTGLEVLWVHHDVHFVLGVARVDGVREAAVVVIPLHHEGATCIVLGMLERRPCLCRPSV